MIIMNPELRTVFILLVIIGIAASWIEKVHEKKTRKKYKSKKVVITPARQKRIHSKRAHKKSHMNRTYNSDLDNGNFTNGYIEACWDELKKN